MVQIAKSAPMAPISAVAWPEPIQRVQLLAERGVAAVPQQYVRPEPQRPGCTAHNLNKSSVPVFDLSELSEFLSPGHDKAGAEEFFQRLREACTEWGFFQVTNHGVDTRKVREVTRSFFDKVPAEEKQGYANDPVTYEGYGSRLGLNKGAVLDWSDYFFLQVMPPERRNLAKWPSNPAEWRPTVSNYASQVSALAGKLLSAISRSLGLGSDSALLDAFTRGADSVESDPVTGLDMGLRINYYPACPQPDLTLGLSPHSDPGGITILLQDDSIAGLQVKHGDSWITVEPIPGALVVNLGDQMQILTNGLYKSVEHRVLVNNTLSRLSVACFINPDNNTLVAPLVDLVKESNKTLMYQPMTFKQYRSFIRRSGTNGKGYLENVASPTSATPIAIV